MESGKGGQQGRRHVGTDNTAVGLEQVAYGGDRGAAGMIIVESIIIMGIDRTSGVVNAVRETGQTAIAQVVVAAMGEQGFGFVILFAGRHCAV